MDEAAGGAELRNLASRRGRSRSRPQEVWCRDALIFESRLDGWVVGGIGCRVVGHLSAAASSSSGGSSSSAAAASPDAKSHRRRNLRASSRAHFHPASLQAGHAGPQEQPVWDLFERSRATSPPHSSARPPAAIAPAAAQEAVVEDGVGRLLLRASVAKSDAPDEHQRRHNKEGSAQIRAAHEIEEGEPARRA